VHARVGAGGCKRSGRRGSGFHRCIVHIFVRRAFAFTAANSSASKVTRIFSGLMLPFRVLVPQLRRTAHAACVSVAHTRSISSSHSRLTCTWLVSTSFILSLYSFILLPCYARGTKCSPTADTVPYLSLSHRVCYTMWGTGR
jgi:hypothetical protein